MLLASVKSLSRFEKILVSVGILVIFCTSMMDKSFSLASMITSMLGVISLIFLAKGNVLGQMMMVIFSVLYAYLSFELRYYSEVITYLFMTLPISALSVFSWLKHPYQSGGNEVKIETVSIKKLVNLGILTIVVTILFYYVLSLLQTDQLLVSTISIATSFLAASLLYLRSPYYALAYGCNDLVLIVLWILAFDFTLVACFTLFFVNDVYGYINWKRMAINQSI